MSSDGPDPAISLFNRWSDSTSFVEILQLFRDLCRECGELDHEQYSGIIPGLKAKLTASWKCQEIFKIYESKAGQAVYKNQECCRGKRCLVIGAGPVGLRTAIEAALLGAKVDVVEKRNEFSRNNVLHLWPFLLTDLRNLGAKKFYGKFCSGDLDHISIRMLQAVLLKAALLLGVKVHPDVDFKSVVEPSGGRGWGVKVLPNTCPVNTYQFDVMLGADGKKYVLPGFRTKEFRPKLAIAITANFANHGTQEEAKVQEISGISYIYHQDFFNRLAEEHGIELENVVYYRDETHYFVMTAKKQSLLRRGVLKQDMSDAQQLLSAANTSPEALKQYAKEVAVYSTKGGFRMETLDFQKNHRGQDDVALFDFTSLSAAENAARIVEREGKTVLMCLVGDSLIEPFWPTGSGCARGFLGVMDAAWMMKGFGEGRDPLDLIEERESTLQLLSQTKPERLHKNFQAYSIDPSTRYLDLAEMVATGDLSHLYDTGQGPQQPTVIIKSSIAGNKNKGISRDRKYKTIGGLNPRKESKTKIDKDFFKSLGSPKSSSTTANNTEGSSAQVAHVKTPGAKSDHLMSSSAQSSSGVENILPKDSPQVLSPSKQASQPSPGSPGSKSKSWFWKSKTPKSKEKETPQDVTEPPSPSSPESTEESNQSKPKSRLRQLTSLVRPSSPKKRPTTPKKSEKQQGSPKQSKNSKADSSSVSPAHTSPNSSQQRQKHPIVKVKEMINNPFSSSPPPAAGSSSPSHILSYKSSPKQHKAPPKPQPEKTVSLSSKQSHAARSPNRKNKLSQSPKSAHTAKVKPEVQIKSMTHSKSLQEMSINNRVSFFQGKINTGFNPSNSANLTASSPKNRQRKKRHLTRREGTDYHSMSGSDGEGDDDFDGPSNLQRKSLSMMDLSQMPSPIVEPICIQIVSDSTLGSSDGESTADGRPECSDGPDSDQSLPSEDGVPQKRLGLKRRSSAGRPVTWAMDSIPETDVPIVTAATSGSSNKLEVPSKTGRALPHQRTVSSSTTAQPAAGPSQSEPLWQARYIASLNKSLETFRKENDVIEAKTALEILNTITSNVEDHPEDDRYRRVRVSSQKFHEKVWAHQGCSSFLLKSGWVEIDDFVVAPIGKSLAQSLRVISKHLSIVNNTIWSMQIELPKSTIESLTPQSSMKRRRKLKRQESYATEVVNSAMDRVAQAALKIRKSPSPTPIAEGDEDDNENEDSYPARTSSMSKKRASEVETMRAAVSAKKKWLSRLQQETFTKPQVEWKPFLEVELYGEKPHNAILRKHSGSSLNKEDRLSGSFDKVKVDVLSSFRGEPNASAKATGSTNFRKASQTQSTTAHTFGLRQQSSSITQPSQVDPKPPSPVPSFSEILTDSVKGQVSSGAGPSTSAVAASVKQPVSTLPGIKLPAAATLESSPQSLPSSNNSSPLSPSKKKDNSLSAFTGDSAMRKVSAESLRSISEEERSDEENEELPDKEGMLQSFPSLEKSKTEEPSAVESSSILEEQNSGDVTSIRKLWVKRTSSSDVPAAAVTAPAKAKSSSLTRGASPSSPFKQNSSFFGSAPAESLSPEQSSMSRSKTMPSISAVATSRKKNLSVNFSVEEAESLETGSRQADSSLPGGVLTGPAISSADSVSPRKCHSDDPSIPTADKPINSDHSQIRHSETCGDFTAANNYNDNNSNDLSSMSSSKSVPDIAGRRDEDRMVVEAGRLAHQMARNMFS